MPIDQKRIAGNSLMLYLRMGVIAIVGLYTTRVVFQALGESDYGIYGVVGGVVMMLSFMNGTMSTACQRFFSYELGTGNMERLRTVFTQCLIAFGIIALITVAFSATGGVWYLTHKAKLAGRDSAAMMAFAFSVTGFVFQIMRTPYTGMIIAKEKMKVFAYVSFVEAFANLGVAIALKHSGCDRLVLYAALMLCVQILTAAFYYTYCRLFYSECRLTRNLDNNSFKRIFTYTGWEMLGTFASVCKTYGVNVLLNPFFGELANAARTISQKVYMTMQQIYDNVYLAVKPQAIKSYVSNESDQMLRLLCQSTRLTLCLLLVVVVPFLMETPFILNIWLGRAPEMAVLFSRLMLVNILVDALSGQFASAIQATGRNKWYQISIGMTLLMILPIGYMGMKFLHWQAVSVFYVSIFVSVAVMIIRIGFVKRQVGLSLMAFLKNVVLRVLAVTVLSWAVPACVFRMIAIEKTVGTSVLVILSCMVWTAVVSYFVGMTGSERRNLWKMIKRK